MKTTDLRQKTIAELKNLCSKERKDLEKTMSEIMQKKEKNSAKAKFARESIARINTVINEKQFLTKEVN
jgi:ribosomal protein L29